MGVGDVVRLGHDVGEIEVQPAVMEDCGWVAVRVGGVTGEEDWGFECRWIQ
jgi:hypothetical protein